jgi:hypothetical protein
MPGSDATSIYFLETLTLPNLRVVSFDSTCFSSPRVLRQFFQKHKRTLTGVSLDRVALEIGSWEQVVIRMREHLRLSTVSIMSLYEGGWERDMMLNLGSLWKKASAWLGMII